MTEAEWLDGAYPQAMARLVRHRGPRKLRLVFAALLARVRPLYAGSLCPKQPNCGCGAGWPPEPALVDLADGVARKRELALAVSAGRLAVPRPDALRDPTAAAYLTRAFRRSCGQAFAREPAETAAYVVGGLDSLEVSWALVRRDPPAGVERHDEVRTEVRRALARVFHDVFGNPFRPVEFDARWRSADAVGLARGIYDGGAFDRLPLLADALMDAGCADDQVIGHCRGDGPHVRGCWVVDLVLGQQ